MRRVILSEVCIDVDIAHGIDRHNLDITPRFSVDLIFIQSPQYHTANASVSINCDINCHSIPLTNIKFTNSLRLFDVYL